MKVYAMLFTHAAQANNKSATLGESKMTATIVVRINFDGKHPGVLAFPYESW